MEITLSEVLEKLRQAEARLDLLKQEIQDLESKKQSHLQEIMKGGGGSQRVKKTGEALREKIHTLSKTKEEVGNLRGQLETKLARFKKELIEEKQDELNDHLERRARYLKRIEELEIEASKYRYLLTGKKDHRLVNVKDSLPSEIQNREGFLPIDEVIGHTKLDVSRIDRMSSEELLNEYLVREKRDDQNP
jgi:chromosome segregation ATPase